MILWLDESGLRSDHTAGRTRAPVGQTPVTRGIGKRFKANMIAAISNTGTLRFRVFEEKFTGPVFLDFLKRLVEANQGRKSCSSSTDTPLTAPASCATGSPPTRP